MRQKPSKYDCLEKLRVDEPYFVLRAQDRLAPEIIEAWAIEAELNDCPRAKISEARAIAKAMRGWRGRRRMPD